MAKMNMIIHDMEGDIELGDTFNNPKFKDSTGHGIKKFDRAVANPMWNQTGFSEDLYTNDVYHRFPAGNPGGKADWGWIQHIFSSLKDNGRAAVVLDTGAASRGSGNAGTNKEKIVRQWFIDNDFIEGVLCLPENLFYNATAPGVIVFLNKNKAVKLKNKVFIINASKEFVKGDPKNYISEEQAKKIAKIYNSKKEVKEFSTFLSKNDIIKNDYNISPFNYIHLDQEENTYSIKDTLSSLIELQNKSKDIEQSINKLLAKGSYGPESRKWDVVKIKDFGVISTGTTPSTKNKNYYDGPYKLISPADLTNSKFINTAHKFISEQGLGACRTVPKNAILVGCIGNIGKIGMTQDDISAFNQQINAIVCNEKFNPDFVYYLLKYHKPLLEGRAARVTVPILNKSNFENIEVEVPDLKTQKQISDTLNLLNKNIESIQSELFLCQRLFKTLLRELMNGK